MFWSFPSLSGATNMTSPRTKTLADVSPLSQAPDSLPTDTVVRSRSSAEVLKPAYFKEYTPAVRWCYTPDTMLKGEEEPWEPYGDDDSLYFEVMLKLQRENVVLHMGEGRVVDLKKRMDVRQKIIGSDDYLMIRGTWFFENMKGGYTPYPEQVSIKLETEFSAGATKVLVSEDPLRYVEIFQNTFRQYRYSSNADRNGRRVVRGYEGRLVLLRQAFKELKLFPSPLIEASKPVEPPVLSDTHNRINRLKTLRESIQKPSKTVGELEREKSQTEIIRKLQEECAKYRNDIKELKKSLSVYEDVAMVQKEEIEALYEELGSEVKVTELQKVTIGEKEEAIMKLIQRLKNFTGQKELVEPGEVNYSEHDLEVKVLKDLAVDVMENNMSYIFDTYKDFSLEEFKFTFSELLKD